MSLSSLLSIARSALLTHRRAMDVTAHNVANAQTPGYSRQRLRLAANPPIAAHAGWIGTGVTDQGVMRTRDRLLDAGYRRESGLLGRSSTMQNYLDQIEAAVGEPTEGGLSSTLDAMFQSFSDLANDPSNPVRRDLVRTAAGRFSRQLSELAGRVLNATQNAVDQLRGQVAEVNTISGRIADLNAQIVAVSATGQDATDLADQRDVLVDQLSSYMSVRVVEQKDGGIAVIAGETTLVDGANSQTLLVRGVSGGGYGIGVTGSGGTIDPQGGSLKGLSELTTTTLPGFMRQLNQLAAAIVGEVNAVHQSGFTLSGATGVDFFDPTGVTALTIGLSADVQASSDAIAAAGTAAPGDAAIALQLAQLGGSGVAGLGGRTFREFYVRFAADVGTQSRNSALDVEGQQTLVDRSDSMRLSVSGVSIDEEMVILIDQQEAYSAAARLIQVAQEMMDDVMRMV